ncbi:MAG: glycoside hydrolase family 32 protein [Planctomycetes bacterium]|nr:glycoside hydrolase family 32 protein [Planctomycetota bacterium]
MIDRRRMSLSVLLITVLSGWFDVGGRIMAEPPSGNAAKASFSSDEALYHEIYRPQFHFTARENWHNDPNGLVWYKGEYHLFFQHNPRGIQWGNMTWGHAVSTDLVHWKQLDHAIYPDEHGTIFSGSAVVDHHNTAGFRTGDEAPIVAVFTYAGRFAKPPKPFTQGIAYSNDRGRTWHKYEGNPVVDNLAPNNRDPKVFWHEPSKRWIMVLYLGQRGKFTILHSNNLKQWKRVSDVEFPNGHECPELFELPVDGNPNDTRWVFWQGDGRHLIGRFDGTRFTPESEVLRGEWGKNCYAGQTWNDVPDGRRIFIAWMAGGRYPGMRFNQQMTFPRRFTLRTTDDGLRLFAYPVREIEGLYRRKHKWSDQPLSPGEDPLEGLQGNLWDIDFVVEPRDARTVDLDIRGNRLRYDVQQQTLSGFGKTAPVAATGGKIHLRVLVDRTSIEVFANEGRIVMSFCYVPDLTNRPLKLSVTGGAAQIEKLEIRALRSIWSE